MCFFFEIPPFEEVQDPSSSPRREEVGRRTLRDYGGFLLPFFYRDRFQWFVQKETQHESTLRLVQIGNNRKKNTGKRGGRAPPPMAPYT